MAVSRSAMSASRNASSASARTRMSSSVRRKVEVVADLAVAVVAGEEAVEELAARVSELVERFLHGERFVDLLDRSFEPIVEDILGRLLSSRGGKAIETHAAGQLADPGPD